MTTRTTRVGWTSILTVAFVNSFYIFVDAEVGYAGKSGDNTVLKNAWLLEQIKLDRDSWLGADSLIAADGSASDGGDLLLNPQCYGPNGHMVQLLSLLYPIFCRGDLRALEE